MIDGYKVLAVCSAELQNDDVQNVLKSLYGCFCTKGWRMIIYSCCTDLSANTQYDCGEASVFGLINHRLADAVIILGRTLISRQITEKIIEGAGRENTPVVVLGGDEKFSGCMNVSFDDTAAFRELVLHLTDKHKFTKIGFVAGHEDNPVSERRLAAFEDVLEEKGIPFDRNNLFGYGNNYSVVTRNVVGGFIKDRDNLPEAIVCFNDHTAINTCEYLSDCGIKVPDEITVTGFGGSEHEMYCYPRVTTCRCDTDALAEFLLDRILETEKGASRTADFEFPYFLDISESCGCRECSEANVLKSINKIYAKMTDGERYDRSMHHMLTMLTGERDSDAIMAVLKKHIQFDTFICLNDDFCKKEKVFHSFKGGNPFTERLDTYSFFFTEDETEEKNIAFEEFIPRQHIINDRDEPLVVSAIHNQDDVYGYMAGFAGDFGFSVHRMQQFASAYCNFLSIYENQYFMDLSNRKLQNIQSRIIHSFADLVESRDDATGQHIKRTGEYVRVLLDHLSKLPQYEDVLTPEMQRRIYAAAPLHDIGKIKISDIILNKPGRLTTEEFEVIKTHTIEGSEIIARTLTNIENDDYLKVANEMALYHHEKWDGSGYLYHLAGEDIPLSARIMAVVDVFDALTSKRVYKDAFSFEEAVNILQESSGTHFDPEIIKVFMSIKDEIHNILLENCDA